MNERQLRYAPTSQWSWQQAWWVCRWTFGKTTQDEFHKWRPELIYRERVRGYRANRLSRHDWPPRAYLAIANGWCVFSNRRSVRPLTMPRERWVPHSQHILNDLNARHWARPGNPSCRIDDNSEQFHEYAGNRGLRSRLMVLLKFDYIRLMLHIKYRPICLHI